VSPKWVFVCILGISACAFCLPLRAQDLKESQWHENSSPSNSDDQQIHEALLKMLDRWNAHDIEGYMEVYQKSPELLVIIDSEQFNGWQQLHDSYINGYADRSTMGFIQPTRIQVKMLKPDLALALTWWSISFPTAKRKVVGTTTLDFEKFNANWKIVASHTSTGG
jgi:ketosteroid isomerase-like protein